MQKFLSTRRGARIVAIVSMGANRTPEHYYQGSVVSVGDGTLMIRDESLGDLAIACEKIVAIKILAEAPAEPDKPEPTGSFEIER